MTTPTRTTTNLSMSMLLDPNDSYSILHANIWGKPEQEHVFIKTETMDVPVEHDLSLLEPTSYKVLDAGDDVSVFPDDKSKMLVRDEYSALWKWITNDRNSPGCQFGGTVVIGQPGIGEYYTMYLETSQADDLLRQLLLNLLLSRTESSGW